MVTMTLRPVATLPQGVRSAALADKRKMRDSDRGSLSAFGRLIRLRLVVSLLCAAAVCVLVGCPASARTLHASIGVHPRLGGKLHGTSAYPRIRGEVGYSPCCNMPPHYISVTLWHAGKLSGRLLTVYAGGHRVGRMRVGSDGRAGLYHSRKRRQYVPRLHPGARVTVRVPVPSSASQRAYCTLSSSSLTPPAVCEI